MGWKLRKGNVSAQSIRPSPTYHHPILCLCPTPDPSHAQSASRSRLRLPTSQLPHAAPVSAARRRPASALAGDKEPPRRRRRAAPCLQQRAPATATKSCARPAATPTSPCDGDQPPPSPATRSPRDGDEELHPASSNEPLRRRVGDCTLPRAPCLGEFLSLPNPI